MSFIISKNQFTLATKFLKELKEEAKKEGISLMEALDKKQEGKHLFTKKMENDNSKGKIDNKKEMIAILLNKFDDCLEKISLDIKDGKVMVKNIVTKEGKAKELGKIMAAVKKMAKAEGMTVSMKKDLAESYLGTKKNIVK